MIVKVRKDKMSEVDYLKSGYYWSSTQVLL